LIRVKENKKLHKKK